MLMMLLFDGTVLKLFRMADGDVHGCVDAVPCSDGTQLLKRRKWTLSKWISLEGAFEDREDNMIQWCVDAINNSWMRCSWGDVMGSVGLGRAR